MTANIGKRLAAAFTSRPWIVFSNALVIVGLPATMQNLWAWRELFNFITNNAPDWLASLLGFVGSYLDPILNAYVVVAAWIFKWLPFDLPNWASAAIPPVLSVTLSWAVSAWHNHRASLALANQAFLEDPEGITLVLNPDVYDDKGYDDYEGVLMESVEQQLTAMSRRRYYRIRALMLGSIFISIYGIELLYVWLIS